MAVSIRGDSLPRLGEQSTIALERPMEVDIREIAREAGHQQPQDDEAHRADDHPRPGMAVTPTPLVPLPEAEQAAHKERPAHLSPERGWRNGPGERAERPRHALPERPRDARPIRVPEDGALDQPDEQPGAARRD